MNSTMTNYPHLNTKTPLPNILKLTIAACLALGIASCGGGSTISLTATPSAIAFDATSTIEWTITNGSSCTASDGWSGNKDSITGSEIVGPLTEDTTFTLTCIGLSESTSESVTLSESVTITVAPSLVTRTLSWDPNADFDQIDGYKVYYGTRSRGCDKSASDEQFIYTGPQSDEGKSPIIIFVADLDDATQPKFKLTNLPDIDYVFAVSAFNTIGESPYSDEIPVSDSFAPALCDASAATDTQVILDFNESVERASSQAITNYTLVDENDVAVAINNITYDNVTFKNVTLNTDPLTENMEYRLTTNNVKDFFAGNAMETTTHVFTYTNAPRIRNISALNDIDGMRVTFDEKVINRTAALSGNYSLDNSLTVTKVQFEDAKNVELTLNNALVEGTTYATTVNNITDLFSNTILMDSLFSFTHDFDTRMPLVLSAHITNPSKNNSKVYVAFSEQIDAISATDVNNYVISNGVTITNASLYSDNRTVILTTSAHADGDYAITVSNITDDSVAANVMDPTELRYNIVSQPANISQKLQATANNMIDININAPTQPKKLQTIAQ